MVSRNCVMHRNCWLLPHSLILSPTSPCSPTLSSFSFCRPSTWLLAAFSVSSILPVVTLLPIPYAYRMHSALTYTVYNLQSALYAYAHTKCAKFCTLHFVNFTVYKVRPQTQKKWNQGFYGRYSKDFRVLSSWTTRKNGRSPFFECPTKRERRKFESAPIKYWFDVLLPVMKLWTKLVFTQQEIWKTPNRQK